MSQRSDENLRGIPMKPYDLLREGLLVFSIIFLITVVLALLFQAPDYPTVRGEDVARRQPLAYLKTTANILAGNSMLQHYGPPYTADYANAQRIFGIAPATWMGVTHTIDPPQDFVLKPLARVAELNLEVGNALQSYRAAPNPQQHAWVTSYLAAIDSASVKGDQVQLPPGNYGPVAMLMDGMLNLGKAGLLEGALENTPQQPYTLNYTLALLFFQDDVDAAVARDLNMLGEQWGISHETGTYPGAWWLWLYTFLYQIPGFGDSPSIDLYAGVIMIGVFLILLAIPFIPVLNAIPRWLGVYKIIWFDWYRDATNPPASTTAEIPEAHSEARHED